MNAAELDIVIGANVQGAVTGLNQVNTQLIKTEKTAENFSTKTKTNFTGLNRVIQDLPFGFIAIQNNLEQVFPAAGALGLAISVVTSALTFAQVGLSNWTRGLGKAKETTDELAKSGGQAASEINKIGALLSVAKDLTENTETRTNAIKELQKEYPGYLSNINLENVNSQQAANAIDLLSGALQRKAKVQALTNLLTKANEELIQAQTSSTLDQLNAFEGFLARLSKGSIFGLGFANEAAKNRSAAIADITSEIDKLTKSLNEVVSAQAKGNDFSLLSPTAPERIKTTTKAIVDEDAALRKLLYSFKKLVSGDNKIPIPYTPVLIQGKEFEDDIKKRLQATQEVIDLSQLGFKVPINFFQLSEIDQKKLVENLKNIAGVVSDTVNNVFTSVGQGIGNTLSGKGGLFSGISQAIGQGLEQLGKYVIAASKLIALIKKALNAALTPLGASVGLAVGIGLIALGKVLQNVPKFATGGVVTSPTLLIAGERGPEKIVPLGYENSAANMWSGELSTRVSGNDFVILLNRTNNNNRNIN